MASGVVGVRAVKPGPRHGLFQHSASRKARTSRDEPRRGRIGLDGGAKGLAASREPAWSRSSRVAKANRPRLEPAGQADSIAFHNCCTQTTALKCLFIRKKGTLRRATKGM